MYYNSLEIRTSTCTSPVRPTLLTQIQTTHPRTHFFTPQITSINIKSSLYINHILFRPTKCPGRALFAAALRRPKAVEAGSRVTRPCSRGRK